MRSRTRSPTITQYVNVGNSFQQQSAGIDFITPRVYTALLAPDFEKYWPLHEGLYVLATDT